MGKINEQNLQLNLAHLQNLIKRDSLSYKDEFLQQLRRWRKRDLSLPFKTSTLESSFILSFFHCRLFEANLPAEAQRGIEGLHGLGKLLESCMLKPRCSVMTNGP